MGFLQGFDYVMSDLYFMGSGWILDMDKRGRIEISKRIASVPARDGDSGGVTEQERRKEV